MSSINALAVFAWPRGRLFPVASPLERFWRASFGVFCCSLFIVFNRKGTTTSSDKKARSRDRRNETTRTRTRTLTIFFCRSQTKRDSRPAGGGDHSRQANSNVTNFGPAYSLFLFGYKKNGTLFLFLLDEEKNKKKKENCIIEKNVCVNNKNSILQLHIQSISFVVKAHRFAHRFYHAFVRKLRTLSFHKRSLAAAKTSP